MKLSQIRNCAYWQQRIRDCKSAIATCMPQNVRCYTKALKFAELHYERALHEDTIVKTS